MIYSRKKKAPLNLLYKATLTLLSTLEKDITKKITDHFLS